MRSPFRAAVLQLQHAHEKQAVRIVGDGAIGNADIGDGRLLPVLILDTSERPDIDECIRVHTLGGAGDAKIQWGRLENRPGTVALIVTFLRPVELVAIVEFELAKSHSVLIEGILRSRGFYVQAGRAGDRLRHDLERPKVMIEAPDTGFGPTWEKIQFDEAYAKMRAAGLDRAGARRAARQAIGSLRDWATLRVPLPRTGLEAGDEA